MITNATNITMVGFTGGQVTNVSDTELTTLQSPACCNVVSGLKGRSGFTSLNATAVTGSPNGIWDFGSSSATRILIGSWNDELFKMDYSGGTIVPDGTWDTVATAQTIQNNIWEFANFSGTALGVNWSRDCLQAWDGSGTWSNVATAPSGQHITVWQNMTVIANLKGDEDAIQRSALNSYTDWAGTGAGTDRARTAGDWGITAIKPLGARLYCFKKKSIHRLSYLGGEPITTLKEIISGTGTYAARTIQYVDDPRRGPILVFLTQNNQIAAFNGYSIEIVSDRIKEDVNGDALITMDALEAESGSKYSHAYVDAKNGFYVCFVVKSGDTSPKYALAWDYVNDSFWPWDNTKFRASCVAELNAGLTFYTQSTSYAYTFYTGDSDDGTAINCWYYTGREGWEIDNILKKGRHVDLIYKSSGGTAFTFSYRTDMDTTTSSPVSCTAANWTTIDIPIMTNMIQYVFRDNSANPKFRIHKVYTSALGIGRAKND